MLTAALKAFARQDVHAGPYHNTLDQAVAGITASTQHQHHLNN